MPVAAQDLSKGPRQKEARNGGNCPLKWNGFFFLEGKFPEEALLKQITVQEGAGKRWEAFVFDFSVCVSELRLRPRFMHILVEC